MRASLCVNECSEAVVAWPVRPKIVWMVCHPTAVWPLARVDVGTSDKCVDGGTSGNRVGGGSSDGRVALGWINAHLLNVVRHDELPCWTSIP